MQMTPPTIEPPLFQPSLEKRIDDRNTIARAHLADKGPFGQILGRAGLLIANMQDRLGDWWNGDTRAGLWGIYNGIGKGGVAAFIAFAVAAAVNAPVLVLAAVFVGTWGLVAVGETYNMIEQVRGEGGPKKSAEAADMTAERAGALPPNYVKQLEMEAEQELKKPKPETPALPANGYAARIKAEKKQGLDRLI